MAYPIIPIVFTWGTPYQSDERVSSARYEDGIEMVERVGINRRKQSIDVNVDITNPVPVDAFLRSRRGRPFRIQTINQLLGEDLLFTCNEWEMPEKSRGCWTFKAKFVQVRRFEEKTLKILAVRTNKTVVVNGETATLTAEVTGFETFPSLVWYIKEGVGSVIQTSFNQAEYRAPINTSDGTAIVIACEIPISGFLRFYSEVSLETVVVPSSEILEAYFTYIYGPRDRETFYCQLRTAGSALKAVNWRIMSGVATLDNPRSSGSQFYVDLLFGQISALVTLRATAASDPNVWREYSILPGSLPPGVVTSIEASVDPAELFVNETTNLNATVFGSGIFSPLVEWLLAQGSGTIANRRYTAGPLPETVILTAYALHASDIRRNVTINVGYRPGPTSISAYASPSSILQNGTAQLFATLSGYGVFDETVVWSIILGEGSISGTTYTAGPNLGTALLRASSLLKPSISQDFEVIIDDPRTVTGITASTNPTTIATDGTSALTAQLTGTGSFNPEIVWSVVSGGGSVVNTFGGYVFVPSSNPSTVVLRAASVSTPTINTTVSITVLLAGVTGITASANPSTIDTEATTALAAQLTGNGSFNPAVAWSIISGGGSITGTQYKAGLNAETVNLKAESVSTPTVNTTISIVVRPAVVNEVTSVTASASSTALSSGQSTPISAQVTGTGSFSTAVTWSIISGGGSINSTMFGMQYTAGSVAESVVLRATSSTTPSKSGTVTIAVSASSSTVTSVTASASTTTLSPGAITSISAQVSGTGSYSTAVNWTIVSGGGTLSSGMSGMQYTAGSVAETVTLRATSSSNPSVSGTVAITVSTSVANEVTSVTASASSTTLSSGTSTPISAQVSGTGSYSTAVIWSIVSGGGSINSTMFGMEYLAGSVSESVVLRATSSTTPSKSGTVTITVSASSSTVTSVTASASATTLSPGGTTSISAQVSGTGSYSTAVNWSIVSGGGTLSSGMSGMQYTAGSVAETVTLRATSASNPSVSGTVTITVSASTTSEVTSVTASASSTNLSVGTSTPISSQVSGTGSYSTAVAWSIDSGGGSINSTMFGMQYVAGSVAGTAILRATSVSTPSKSGTVTITVTA